MQKLLVVIVLVLNCSHNVRSSFFSLIAQAFEELGTNISNFFSNVHKLIKLASKPRNEYNGDSYIHVTLPLFKKQGNKDHAQPLPARGEAAAVRLAAAHGRALQQHRVYTQDGYILTLHRLLPRLHAPSARGVVLLHHGLFGSSADWILQGPGKSLPYLLSDAGYDVWLANSRGNYYSRSHLFKSPNTVAYWDFSWQEIGEKDLPAIFDYITTLTACERINYVGHGMGATALLVLLSVRPEYNKYVRMAVLLAPLAIMKRTRGPLHDFALNLDDYFYTGKEYFPTNKVPEKLSRGYCQVYDSMCRNSLLFFTGVLLQKNDTDTNFIPLLFYHVPAGGSEKTMQHYAELVINRKFHKFGNEEEEFPLANISASIAIFSSSDDWLSDVYDNDELYSTLPNAIGHVIFQSKKVSHTEFVWGHNAHDVIFNKVIDLIQNGTNINEVK